MCLLYPIFPDLCYGIPANRCKPLSDLKSMAYNSVMADEGSVAIVTCNPGYTLDTSTTHVNLTCDGQHWKNNNNQLCEGDISSKHETLSQWWVNAGPTSKTLDQH